MAGLDIDARREGPIALLKLSGEARLEVIDALRSTARTLRTEGAKHFVLSLKDVKFVDSASVGILLELQKETTAGGGQLVLCAIPARIARMFDAMALTGRFRIAATEEKAREACVP